MRSFAASRRFLGVACHLLVKPIAVEEAVVPKNIVASIRDDNDRWARGSPPLQTFKRVLDALDDVRQPTTPFEIVPDRLAAWWEEVRLLLDVLADVPSAWKRTRRPCPQVPSKNLRQR